MRWIPAFAGKTEWEAGKTVGEAGKTGSDAGIVDAG
jgi:hypothetical protein